MNQPTGKIASPILRTIAFAFDFVFCLFFARNYLVPYFLPEGWDVLPDMEIYRMVWPAYAIGLALFLARDIFAGLGIGKYLLNIRVAVPDEKLNPAHPKQTIQRNIVLILLPVEVFALILNRYCRRIGDQWANTVVLLRKPVEGIRFFTKRVLVFFLLFGILWIGYVLTSEEVIRKTVYYRLAADHLRYSQTAKDTIGTSFDVARIVENSINENGEIELLLLIETPSNGDFKGSYRIAPGDPPKLLETTFQRKE